MVNARAIPPTTDPAAASPPAATGASEVLDEKALRLGEMVAGLTGCDRETGIEAARTVLLARPGLDPLAVVARAVVAVDQPREGG
jgi:hypothetical protein